MKKILTIALFLGVIHAKAQYQSATLQASGLTCSMCSKAIYKSLLKINFVDTVTTDIKNAIYTITFKKEKLVNFDAIKNAVTDAGFAVANLKVSTLFSNVAIANDSHISLGGSTLHFVHVPTKSIDGLVSITLIDKNFTTTKEHKRLAAFTTYKCYATGKMESCCTKGLKEETRVYHVTI